MDYLIVPEAEDGTWYGEELTAVGLDEARKMARGKWEGRVPRGYEVMIYSLSYVEAVDFQKAESK
jgi:hypothetical protein